MLVNERENARFEPRLLEFISEEGLSHLGLDLSLKELNTVHPRTLHELFA